MEVVLANPKHKGRQLLLLLRYLRVRFSLSSQAFACLCRMEVASAFLEGFWLLASRMLLSNLVLCSTPRTVNAGEG